MTLLALAIAQQYALSYRMVPGETHPYILEYTYKAQDGEEFGVKESVRYRIGEPGEDKLFPVTVEVRLLANYFGGETHLPAAESEPFLRPEKRDRRGQVLDRKDRPGDANTYARILRVLDLVYLRDAVAVGQTWERTVGLDSERNMPAARWRWTLLQPGDIELDFAETTGGKPWKAVGRFKVDMESGWPDEATVIVDGVVMPGDELAVPGELTLKSTRVLD